MTHRVAIVGGGISGLAAAYTLKKAGIRSVVYEKESHVGGRMGSETVAGCIIDTGAYTIPASFRVFKRILSELGVKDHLVKTPATSATFLAGEAHDIKVGSPADFLKYKLLSTRSKIKLVKLALYAKSLGKALDLSSPSPTSLALEQETAADYILQRYNDEILERIAYPIFCEIFLGTPEANSKLAFLATVSNLSIFPILALENGMGSLPEYLSQTVDVRLGTPVRHIQKARQPGGYQLRVGKNGKKSVHAEAVILALPLPVAADMLVDASDSLRASFKAIPYNPCIVTAWGLDQPGTDHAMINNFLRKEGTVIGTVVFDDLKARSRVPAGKGLATVILRESASRSLFDAPEEKIHKAVLSDMNPVFPSFADRVSFARTYRWKHAAIQLPPGALAEKQSLRNTLARTFDRLFIASDSLEKTGIETSLKTGIAAAENAMKVL